MTKLEEKFINKIQLHFKCSIHSAFKISEFTEQECIAFKKFCEESPISGSDERLFQLYQKSKENE